MVSEKRTKDMNRKRVPVLLLFILVVLAGIPESFARSRYIPGLTAVYGDGSCGTCHVRASGGGPRNSYGTLFENQANHAADPAAALKAIGQPPGSVNPAVTTATATPAETAAVTTDTVIPAAPVFGITVSLAGLFVCAFLVRMNKK